MLSKTIIEREYRELSDISEPLSRSECEQRFPNLVAYVLTNISAVDLLASQGIELTPISPDTPGVLIAKGACPDCRGNLIVRGNVDG